VRKLATVGMMGLLAGTLGFVAVAGAAGTVAPKRVTARVTPHHISKPPFRFTTDGKIKLPSKICPPGTTNHAYCSKPPANACSGKVQISVRLGKDSHLADAGKTVASATVEVKSNCKYSDETTIPNADMTATSHLSPHESGRYVGVDVHVRFLGNSVLSAESAPTQIVIAKLING
jgi:hypothetical protein